MGIRDNYKTEAAKPVAAAKSAASAQPASGTNSVGVAGGQTPKPSAEDRKKILDQIQAKLKARQQESAAVNPPEASEQLTPDKLEPAPDVAAEQEESDEIVEETPNTAAAPAPAPIATKRRGRPPGSGTSKPATPPAPADGSRDWPTFFETVSTHELLAEQFRRFR